MYIVLKFHAAKTTSSTLKELGKSVTKLMSGPVYRCAQQFNLIHVINHLICAYIWIENHEGNKLIVLSSEMEELQKSIVLGQHLSSCRNFLLFYNQLVHV